MPRTVSTPTAADAYSENRSLIGTRWVEGDFCRCSRACVEERNHIRTQWETENAAPDVTAISVVAGEVSGGPVVAAALLAIQEMGAAAAIRTSRARTERGRTAAATRWRDHLSPAALAFVRLVAAPRAEVRS